MRPFLPAKVRGLYPPYAEMNSVAWVGGVSVGGSDF